MAVFPANLVSIEGQCLEEDGEKNWVPVWFPKCCVNKTLQSLQSSLNPFNVFRFTIHEGKTNSSCMRICFIIINANPLLSRALEHVQFFSIVQNGHATSFLKYQYFNVASKTIICVSVTGNGAFPFNSIMHHQLYNCGFQENIHFHLDFSRRPILFQDKHQWPWENGVIWGSSSICWCDHEFTPRAVWLHKQPNLNATFPDVCGTSAAPS